MNLPLPNFHNLASGARDTFAAFRHPNYRLWAVSLLISSMGGWMQSTAQGYLIYQITQSPAYLGYISFASGIPIWFLTLYGGLVADRVSRRLLLFITQSVMMLTAFTLAALIFTGRIQAWHVLLASFCLGMVNAFDGPTRQVFVVELVGKEDLTNAIALNSTIFHTATMLGPAVGGVVYALYGPAWCFTFNGLSYLAVLAALLLIRLEPYKPVLRGGSTLNQLREGLVYVRNNRTVVTLLISLCMVMMFGFGVVTLIPAWAVDVLGGNVKTNGLMLSARGAGALLGGMIIAILSSQRVRGRLLSLASFTLPALLLGFALLRWLPGSLLALAGIGWSLIILVNLTNSLLQSLVPDEMRGRVMGLYILINFGANPIGSLITGSSAAHLGPPTAVLINTALLACFAVFIWLRRPFMRRLE